jgi:hypothetical protein
LAQRAIPIKPGAYLVLYSGRFVFISGLD